MNPELRETTFLYISGRVFGLLLVFVISVHGTDLKYQVQAVHLEVGSMDRRFELCLIWAYLEHKSRSAGPLSRPQTLQQGPLVGSASTIILCQVIQAPGAPPKIRDPYRTNVGGNGVLDGLPVDLDKGEKVQMSPDEYWLRSGSRKYDGRRHLYALDHVKLGGLGGFLELNSGIKRRPYQQLWTFS